MSCKNYLNTNIRYEQTNRTIEKFLLDLRVSKQVQFHLESCNVCSSCCAVEAVGGDWKIKLPTLHNKEIMSQADIMFNYIYSYPDGMPMIAEGICENECIDNLSFAINQLSTAKAKVIYFNENKKLEALNDIINNLNRGSAIVLSYADNLTSGHFICIVDYNASANSFVYYDSWKKNPRNKSDGKLELFSFEELKSKMKPRYMIVSE